MNIIVFGAGAIGSLFGGLLAKNNNVVLIGRKPHVDAIQKNGLTINGKTRLKIKTPAFDNVKEIGFSPDLVIISVKSFDTETAIKQLLPLISKETIVMSMQNGLDNIEKIGKHVDKERMLVCITTHGAVFSKPGIINHTGIGKTTIGAVEEDKTGQVNEIVDLFNKTGIKTTVSRDIVREIWVKAIVNSSINPLTTFFQCKNGYLVENPILEKIVEKTCKESTAIANSNGLKLDFNEMINRTFEVINETSENTSSMFQSYQKGKMTEIDSINGVLVETGKKNGVATLLNEALVYSVKKLNK